MATSFHLYLKGYPKTKTNKDGEKRVKSPKKNGEYPIYLRITNNRKHKYISTGLSVKKDDWHKDKEEVRRSHDNYKALNKTLRAKVKEAENVQSDLVEQGQESAKAIQERIKNTQTADLFEMAKELEANYSKTKKYYSSRTLKGLLNKLEEFEGESSLPFNKIDSNYLQRFEEFLRNEHGNKDSTINKKFEPFRKLINMALQRHLIPIDPFISYSVPTRKKATSKTKLTIEQIRAIEAIELKKGSYDWHIRNAFLFSFYSGGIRFGDICCLTWNNVKDGKLSYQMNKNEKPFTSDLNEYQIQILANYSGAGSEFIFPFLNNHKDYSDPVVLRKAINIQNVKANGKSTKTKKTGLKNIAELAGITENISFHVSRHSFAQYAVSDKGLSMYETMQVLRHSKIETTQRYLKGLDEELANKAMKKVF
ncbi:MAG: site-specific integrase [Balneolaceae bacterium]|nr:site-specific integrase [Balneolaceae bacterium]